MGGRGRGGVSNTKQVCPFPIDWLSQSYSCPNYVGTLCTAPTRGMCTYRALDTKNGCYFKAIPEPKDGYALIKLRKFLPGSDLLDGRYLMDDTRILTVRDGMAHYLFHEKMGETFFIRWVELKHLWDFINLPVWGVLPLEGEEE